MAAKKKAPVRRRPAPPAGPVEVVKEAARIPTPEEIVRDLEYCNKRLGSQLDESQRILADTRAALKAIALIFGRQRGSGY